MHHHADWPTALTPYLAALPALPLRLERAPAGRSTEMQTARTISRMTRLAAAGARSTPVAAALAAALDGLEAQAPASAKARRIFWWVKDHVAFRDDPAQDELLLSPELLLAMPQPAGDCDDFSTLTAALLTAAGIPWEFVTVAADRSEPQRFSHVYLRAHVEDDAGVLQ